MFLRITALLALALATGLIAAGCGDDDDDTTTTTTSSTTTAGATGATGATGEPLSKEEFIAEADAICKAGTKEIQSAGEDFFPEGGSPGQAEEETFTTDVVVPNIQGQVDAIRALTPPEGDEEAVTAILDAAQEAIDELEDDPSGQNNPFAEADQLAQDYGLEVCGSN